MPSFQRPRRTFFFLSLLASLASLAGTPAQADSFPSKPIRVLIGFTAGGSTDVPFRVLAANASKILGQAVIIENKPGAGGVLPAQMMQSTAADGYTLAQIALPVLRLPYTTKINWNPATDLDYVINLGGYTFGLVVAASSPIKTMADYMAYAKANPGQLSYGTPGALTTLHLTMEGIALQSGVTLNHIPYKGNSESLQAVLGGHVMSIADTPGWAPYVDQGKLRLLATWGEQRSAKYPKVATLKESGINLVQTSPFGLALPKGVDPKVVKILHDAFKQAMEMPNYKEALAKFDMDTLYMDGPTYTRYVADTMKAEQAVIAKLGLGAGVIK